MINRSLSSLEPDPYSPLDSSRATHGRDAIYANVPGRNKIDRSIIRTRASDPRVFTATRSGTQVRSTRWIEPRTPTNRRRDVPSKLYSSVTRYGNPGTVISVKSRISPSFHPLRGKGESLDGVKESKTSSTLTSAAHERCLGPDTRASHRKMSRIPCAQGVGEQRARAVVGVPRNEVGAYCATEWGRTVHRSGSSNGCSYCSYTEAYVTPFPTLCESLRSDASTTINVTGKNEPNREV